MAAPKFNKEERAHITELVWAYRVNERLSFRAIAERLKEAHGYVVDHSTVYRYAKASVRRKTKRISELAEQELVLQLDTLQRVVSESLQAWEASKKAENAVSRRTKSVPKKAGDIPDTASEDEIVEKILTEIVKQKPGNLAFLREARAAMADIRDILPIEAPLKIALTDPTGKEEYAGGLSDPERIAGIAALLDRARERRDRQAAVGDGDEPDGE